MFDRIQRTTKNNFADAKESMKYSMINESDLHMYTIMYSIVFPCDMSYGFVLPCNMTTYSNFHKSIQLQLQVWHMYCSLSVVHTVQYNRCRNVTTEHVQSTVLQYTM